MEGNRHLVRHGDQFKPVPSGRIRKACTICHRGKVKCDGAQPCSKCSLKRLECVYEQVDNVSSSEDLPTGTQTQGTGASRSSAAGSPNENAPTTPSQSGTTGFEAGAQGAIIGPQLTASRPNLLPIPVSWNPGGIIDWSSVKIRRDTLPNRSSQGRLEFEDVSRDDYQLPIVEDEVGEVYLQKYFEHFHYRWPIIHRPGYEDQSHSLLLKTSVKMVGAWFQPDEKSREYALAMHKYLLNCIPVQLAKKSSSDVLHEKHVSRAAILRNTLVGVLREAGFFDHATVTVDEKPGYFLPLHMKLLGDRNRLAAYLYKIDNYFSIIRGQPPLLMTEELHFPIPSTLAFWDAEGLVIWEGRMMMEPAKKYKSMADMIRSNNLGLVGSTEDLLLMEDVQLCLCSFTWDIWRLSESSRNKNLTDDGTAHLQDPLQRRLDALQVRLEQMGSQYSNYSLQKQNQDLDHPLRFYYGYEDYLNPNDESIVLLRANSLIFDALIFKQLLDLHLHADVRTLQQLAKDQGQMGVPGLSLEHQRERQQSMESTANWTNMAAARRSLCNATEILMLHQHLGIATTTSKRTLDPISEVAIATAALIIWAYCKFGKHCCPVCCAFINEPLSIAAELTKWCKPFQGDKEKYIWIEVARDCPVEIEGTRFCRCNVDALVAKFQVYIKEDWKLVDTIAPGVFKFQYNQASGPDVRVS
ncbi:hypothetical protein G7Y89_g12199 [Cudoniella acicularis]|uniref:Zn(2)-C6 fungal-type domain-containing protein n=1 Tax=Cudoniella acicularis TaxID=354080 RepID=A0A8H4RBV2_9HELO|nr:hypothetical protein G7Y89_g12199 [Cudoniella acicularis]